MCITSSDTPLFVRGKHIPLSGTPQPSVQSPGQYPAAPRVQQGEGKMQEHAEEGALRLVFNLGASCGDAGCIHLLNSSLGKVVADYVVAGGGILGLDGSCSVAVMDCAEAGERLDGSRSDDIIHIRRLIHF